MALNVDDIRSLVAREVDKLAEGSLRHRASDADTESRLAQTVEDRVIGYGPLQPMLDDPGIEEIWLNAPDEVFVARAGVASRVDIALTDAEVRRIVERMLWQAGRRIDVSMPFVDASLPDGSRLHVVIPDITPRHWAVNIRKFSREIRTLADLVSRDSLSQQAAELLRMCVLAGLNIIVSGSTQAGKTTMLNALVSMSRPGERIITVEETRELDIVADDLVALQGRAANLEAQGEVSLRRLISEALRMRPTRLVVGEVRGAESLDLLIALNSGLAGACSVHANSAVEALNKLCALPLLAGGNVDARFVATAVGDCVDIVVHCTVERTGHRRVREVVAVSCVAGVPEPVILMKWNGSSLVATGDLPRDLEKFDRAGLTPADVVGRST